MRTVLSVCDPCYADNETNLVAATTHTITLDDQSLMTIELCDVHTERLIVPLARVLSAHGQFLQTSKPATPRKKTRELDLVACDVCPAKLRSIGGMRTHLKESHHASSADAARWLREKGYISRPTLPPRNCSFCGITFAGTSGLKAHQRHCEARTRTTTLPPDHSFVPLETVGVH